MLSVASRPRCDASGVIVRAPKVIAPVFVVRLIPVPPDDVTDVAAKLSAALDVLTLIPMPVGLVMVVEPLVKLPATVVKLMPVVALLVELMLPKLPFRVPVERFSACPVPFNVTSEMLSVPKLVPLMSEVELPPVNPRNVLPEATVIPTPALVMFTIAPLGFGGGKASLPTGGVMPVIEERLAVASCPMNLWPLSKVTGPT